jgi:hypothetical protein
MRQRQPRMENPKHLRFIASCPCLICGAPNVQAAHIRYADPEAGKRSTGMAEKSDDCFTVPLCVAHHSDQHEYGDEHLWWTNYGVDPVKVALRLYSVTGDHDRAGAIITSLPIFSHIRNQR